MPIPNLHTITLRELVVPKDICPFVVSCSCQWAGLAHTLAKAEDFVQSHAYAQAGRGNQVIIKRELQKPSVVDDPQE